MVVALALLPVLMGVAAAQPVVVRHHLLGQRQDVQVFFVFDTSQLDDRADGATTALTRLARAKREAEGGAPEARRHPGGPGGDGPTGSSPS